MAVVAESKANDDLAASKKKAAASSKANKADTSYEKQQNQVASLNKELELLKSGSQNVAREMAIFNAVQNAGAKATEAQKKAIAAEAADIFDLTQSLNDFRAAAEITPELKLSKAFADDAENLRRLFEAGLIDTDTFTKLGQEAAQKFQVGMADIKVAAVVSPLEAAKGKIDPVQALANQHAEQLALIQQFETEKGVLTLRGIELMNAANTEYEQARIDAQWEIWRNQDTVNQLLADSLDALGQRATNAITGLLTQTQTATDALKNLALTIAQEAVGALVDLGKQQIKNMAVGKMADTQAVASAAATGASITASMAPAAAAASVATMGTAATYGLAAMSAAIPAIIGLFGGGRKNGGSVSAGNMYQVGEGGLPELYQSRSGKQYMIPGDSGKVISNKNMGGSDSAGGSQNINITINMPIQNTNGGVDGSSAQMLSGMVATQVRQILEEEMRPGGMLPN
ncbi:Uncharacterised protein [Yersinia frederiksenii]|nr:Uncharacterised protein [Yersinia frederiksenii]